VGPITFAVYNHYLLYAETDSQTTYQITGYDYIKVIIFNTETIKLTYFILNVYLENADKMT
jgi:hypothetical protein